MRATILTTVFTKTIPVVLESETLYVSMEYKTAVHLCACGCGTKVVTPLGPHDWILTFDGTVSLRPSVGNGQQPCRSHYYIRGDRVDWLPRISVIATRKALVRDLDAHVEVSDESSIDVTWWRRIRERIRSIAWSNEKHMNMTPASSDNVALVGYDHSTLVLRVAFRNGGTYDYYGIPAYLYEAMLQPHPWRLVGRQIRAYGGHCVAA